MSLKTKVLSVSSLMLGLAIFSTGALAQETAPTTPTTPDKLERKFKHGKAAGRGFGRHHGKHGGKMGALRGLNLTDAQKAQIKAIRQSSKPDQAAMTELRSIRDARKAGTAITPEQKTAIRAFRDQRKAKAQSNHEQILAILTPEQRAQLEASKAEMQQRRELRKTERKNRRLSSPAGTPIIK